MDMDKCSCGQMMRMSPGLHGAGMQGFALTPGQRYNVASPQLFCTTGGGGAGASNGLAESAAANAMHHWQVSGERFRKLPQEVLY